MPSLTGLLPLKALAASRTLVSRTSEQLLIADAPFSGGVQRAQEALKIALLTVEKLKVELAYLRRMKYGRSTSGSTLAA